MPAGKIPHRESAAFFARRSYIKPCKTVYHIGKGACQTMAAIQDITREMVFSLLPLLIFTFFEEEIMDGLGEYKLK